MIQNEFYFVRHGQTEANAEELMAGGGWDVALNDIGEKQALIAAEIFSREVDRFDHIFVSDMTRTRQTAVSIQERYPDTPVTFTKDLIEWKVGDWEKQPWAKVQQDFYDRADPPGGEPREAFKSRIWSGVKKCVEKPGKNLIVSHGGVWWYLMKIMQLKPFLVENCTPYRVWQTGEIWRSEAL